MAELGEIIEAGKAIAKKGKEVAKEKYEKGKIIVTESGEDVKEILNLADDFSTIADTQVYIREHRHKLDDIGLRSALKNPEESERMIREFNDSLKKALLAVGEIQTKKLRFSREYLEEPIQRLSKVLEELNGLSARLLNNFTSGTFTGWLTSLAYSEPDPSKVASLNLELKTLKSNSEALQQSIQSLIDPTLTKPSNNRILNPYLGIKKKADDLRDVANTINHYKEEYDSAKGVVTTTKKKILSLFSSED